MEWILNSIRPSTAFKTLLSLIPSIYKTDFDKIKTSGNASFDGM